MRRPLLRERVWAVAKAWSWSEAGMIDTNKELAAGDRVPACYPLLFDLRERLAVVTLQKMMYN